MKRAQKYSARKEHDVLNLEETHNQRRKRVIKQLEKWHLVIKLVYKNPERMKDNNMVCRDIDTGPPPITGYIYSLRYHLRSILNSGAVRGLEQGVCQETEWRD